MRTKIGREWELIRATRMSQEISISNNYVAAKLPGQWQAVGLGVGLGFTSLPSGVRVEHAVWKEPPRA